MPNKQVRSNNRRRFSSRTAKRRAKGSAAIIEPSAPPVPSSTGPDSKVQHAGPKTSRDERADRRSRLRELQEQSGKAEKNRKMAEQQLKMLQDEQALWKPRLEMLEEVVAHQPQLLIEDSEQCHTVTRFSTEPVGYVRPYITIPAATRVYECWRDLDGKVEALSGYLSDTCTPPISWDSLGPAIQERLTRLAPKAKQYLEADDEFSSRFIFQAWIWRILDEKLFSNKEGPWVGEHWAAYSQLRSLGAHLATSQDSQWTVRYHIWRNLTVGMIRHVTGNPETRVSPDVIVKALNDELGPVFRQIPQPELEKDLSLIAKRAVEADLCMHLDRSDWTVISCHPDTGAMFGFPFKGGKREDGFRMVASDMANPLARDEDINGRPVDLIAVPLLVHRGTSNGFNYSITHNLTPMQVVVDQFPDEGEPA